MIGTRRIPPGGAAAVAFLARQQRDWRVTVARTSLDRLAYQIVFPYLSVYIVALGASATELGLVNSLGLVAAGLVSPFIGWLIDRNGPRSFYLLGIGLLAVSYLTYAVAQNWPMAIAAMIALLARVLDQRPQLRDDLRQLPREPRPCDRDDGL